MKITPSNIVWLMVFGALTIITLTILFEGPITDVLKDENTFVETHHLRKSLETPLKWPALTICKSPRDKNKEKFLEFISKGRNKTFSNESEYQTLLDEAFFTKPEDILRTISIGPNVMTSLQRAKLKEIPVQSPYVESILVDFEYMGNCATIKFEALRNWMIDKGELKKDDIDSKFIGIIVTKGSAEKNSKDYLHFTQENELVDMVTASRAFQMALPSSITVYNVDIGLKNKITKCNPAISKMTPCVEKYYDQNFGRGHNDMVERIINFTHQSYEGKHSLEEMTGCQQPCAITEYYPISVVSMHKDHIRDGTIELFENETDGVIFFNHTPQEEVIKIDEVPRYSIIGFISDVGGIIGVFLGLSFWSLHTLILGPLIEKLEKAICSQFMFH